MIARPICRPGSINTLRCAAALSTASTPRLLTSLSSSSSALLLSSSSSTKARCIAPRTHTVPTFKTRLANRSFFATMASSVPFVTLNDGNKMPQVGFGLWKVDNATCADTVYNAIKAGYRLFDGACGTSTRVEHFISLSLSLSALFLLPVTPPSGKWSAESVATARRPELPVAAVDAWPCIGMLASSIGTKPEPPHVLM